MRRDYHLFAACAVGSSSLCQWRSIAALGGAAVGLVLYGRGIGGVRVSGISELLCLLVRIHTGGWPCRMQR
jgi:hypothetical protein